MNTVQRRYDIDWLRVGLILAVLVYHTSSIFGGDWWHITSSQPVRLLGWFTDFAEPWMMTTIFVISAAAISFSLRREKVGKFLGDKVKRLLVPLILGMLVLCAPIVYVERMTDNLNLIDHSPEILAYAQAHAFTGSFWQFIPHYFEGIYGLGGNFPVIALHLWYMQVLFIYTLVMLPLFLFLKSKIGARIVHGLGSFLEKPGAIYLLALVIVIPLAVFDEDGLGFRALGGNSPIVYLTYFLLGYVIFSDERIQQAIVRQRYISLAVALLITYPFFHELTNPTTLFGLEGVTGEGGSEALFGWSWMLTMLGFAMKYLNRESRAVRYAGEATLPFYILHQPVLAVLAYLLMPIADAAGIPGFVQFLALAVLTFAVDLAMYEVLVRRFNLMRVLFGMKPLPRARVIEKAAVPAD